MRPTISVGSDPTALAEMLATLIRSDRRTGLAEPIAHGVRYAQDPKGVDLWSNPRELNIAGKGDCAKLVRAVAQSVGPDELVYIVVARTEPGFHTWIEVRYPKGVEVIDPSADRGMPRPPADLYQRGVAVRLWPEGKEAVKQGSIVAERPRIAIDYMRAAWRLAGAQKTQKDRRRAALDALHKYQAEVRSEAEKRTIAALIAVLGEEVRTAAAIRRKLAAKDGSAETEALAEAVEAVHAELVQQNAELPILFGDAPASPPATYGSQTSDAEIEAMMAALAPGCPGSCDL